MSPLLWGALGAVLIAAELVIPGIFLVWFGGAALLTGLVTALWHDWGLVNEAGFFTLPPVLRLVSPLSFRAAATHRRKAVPHGSTTAPASLSDAL